MCLHRLLRLDDNKYVLKLSTGLMQIDCQDYLPTSFNRFLTQHNLKTADPKRPRIWVCGKELKKQKSGSRARFCSRSHS